MTKSERKRCPGVNKSTGRLKKGYRERKGGGCPVKAKGSKK